MMIPLLIAQTVIVSAAEAKLIVDAEEFWSLFRQTRFHDYARRSTRVPIRPQQLTRTVKPGPNADSEFAGLDLHAFTEAILEKE